MWSQLEKRNQTALIELDFFARQEIYVSEQGLSLSISDENRKAVLENSKLNPFLNKGFSGTKDFIQKLAKC